MRRDWAVSSSELTPKQIYAIEKLDPFGNFGVCGPPGSGKTNILLLRTKYLQKKFRYKSVLALVYTSALKEFIRKGIQEYNVNPNIVQTFHGWGKNTLRDYDYDTENDFDKVAFYLEKVLKSDHKPHYDFLLVDEAQDFPPKIIKLFFLLSDNVTLYFDRLQSIFEYDDARMSEYPKSIRPFSDKFKKLIIIEESHRVPYKIAQLATSIMPSSKLDSITIEDDRGDYPIYQPFDTEKEEILFIKSRIEDIPKENPDYNFVILQRTNKKELPDIYEKLSNCGLDTEPVAYGYGLPECNYSNTIPKLITYHSVKGLEFDVVFAAGATPSAFPGGNRDKHLAFVAVTRSRSRLYITGSPGISIVYKPPVRKEDPIDITIDDLF